MFDELFPKVKREIRADTIIGQTQKVREEAVEVLRECWPKPVDDNALELEVGDVLIAAATLVRMVAERTGSTPAEIIARTHEKNRARGYYETPITVTITNTLEPIRD